MSARFARSFQGKTFLSLSSARLYPVSLFQMTNWCRLAYQQQTAVHQAESGETLTDVLTWSGCRGFWYFLIIGSFVGGLLGWLLITRKPVLECSRCGAIVSSLKSLMWVNSRTRCHRKIEILRNFITDSSQKETQDQRPVETG